MNNKFKFHPVGQGLFYTGQLAKGEKNEFNFVYDCGTISAQKYLNDAIDNYVKTLNNKEIDFLIVSHLDKDHISGIYELYNKVKANNKVIKKIYLPYYPDKNILIVLIIKLTSKLKIQQKKELRNFWFGLYGIDGYSKSEGIEEIVFCGNENDKTEGVDKDYIIKRVCELDKAYKSLEWKFIMFNKQLCSCMVNSLKSDIDKFLKNKNCKELSEVEFNDENEKELQKIYDKHIPKGKRGRNASSTILIHYPETFYVSNISYQCNYNDMAAADNSCHDMRHDISHKSNQGKIITYLTGDIEFDDELLRNLETSTPSSENMQSKKIFQIPHHGSKKNWNLVGKLKNDFDCYIISLRDKNKQKCNIEDIINDLPNCKKVNCVTECHSFHYNIIVEHINKYNHETN